MDIRALIDIRPKRANKTPNKLPSQQQPRLLGPCDSLYRHSDDSNQFALAARFVDSPMTTATLPLAQPRLFYGRDYYPKIKTIDSFATLQPIRADGYDNVTPQQPMVNERSERLHRTPSSLLSPFRGLCLCYY